MLMLSSCGTYAGSGAATGGYFGSIVGYAIGGITGGWRGHDIGSLVGLAGGAVVGAAIGAAADNASAETGDYSQFEPYGLTYQNFVSENDVQILNADTTEIAVSKKLADKLGITSFVNHPLGIWQGIDQLPYARKAKEERLEGDMYILTVAPATVAELVGDKMAMLNTSIYVNDDAEAVQTRGQVR